MDAVRTRLGYSVDPPLSDPVEEFLATGVPREEMRPREKGGRGRLGDTRAATIGFPIAPAHLPSGSCTRGPTVERRI